MTQNESLGTFHDLAVSQTVGARHRLKWSHLVFGWSGGDVMRHFRRCECAFWGGMHHVWCKVYSVYKHI